jgi:hypothetical protein
MNLKIKSYRNGIAIVSYGDEYKDKEILYPEEMIINGVLSEDLFLPFAIGFIPEEKPKAVIKNSKYYNTSGSWNFVEYKDISIDGAVISTEDGITSLIVEDKIWMKNNKFSILELQSQVDDAYGNVLIGGLGLGIVALLVASKDNVSSVTVIEKDARVIKLFESQGFNTSKIKIISEDLYKHVGEYNVALFDHYNRSDEISTNIDNDYLIFKNNIKADIYNFYLWYELTSSYEDYIIWAQVHNSKVYSKEIWKANKTYTPTLSFINTISNTSNEILHNESSYIISLMVNEAIKLIRANPDIPSDDTTFFVKSYFIYNIDNNEYQAVGISWKFIDSLEPYSSRIYSAKYQYGEISDFYEIYKSGDIYSSQLDIKTKEVICNYPGRGDNKVDPGTGDIIQLNTFIDNTDNIPSEVITKLTSIGFPYIDDIFYYCEKPYGRVIECMLTKVEL